MTATALITGASAGIGRELCNVLAEKGWDLVLVARREERLLAIRGELEAKYKVQVGTVRADLANPGDRARVVELIEKSSETSPIRFVVNNAGLQSRGVFDQTDYATAASLIEVNVAALAELSHAALACFRKSGERCYLLNIGSVNSFISTGDSAVYSGTKAFVKSFSVALAEELRGTQITCTCFCPGGTDSEMLASAGIQMKQGSEKLLMRADHVARLGIEAALAGRTLAIPGFTNQLSVFFSRFIGDRASTRISSRILRRVMERADR